MLPSQFAEQVDQSALQLHFANQIWKHNTAEIMGHPDECGRI
jgi:3-hydroxybutyryl-CoA dehydrogenase